MPTMSDAKWVARALVAHVIFVGNSLVSWSSKKQNCVALSTTEAEYIIASFCCAQILWVKQNLMNFELHFHNTRIFCDNYKCY